MDTAPWLTLVKNEIICQNKELAPVTYNVDDMTNTVCIKGYVWRFHSELDAWIYALRETHSVLYFMRDVYVYKTDSEFSNTFCLSEKPIQKAAKFHWLCIYSKKHDTVAESRMASCSPRRKSSMDLSSVMIRMRQKRRSSSLPSEKLLKGLKT